MSASPPNANNRGKPSDVRVSTAANTMALLDHLVSAGKEATKTMVDLVRGRSIECFDVTLDRYGRTVALCFADDVNLSAEMVRSGMAWAFVRYSRDYVTQETEAKAARLGVHAHQCEKAWDYRLRIRGDR